MLEDDLIDSLTAEQLFEYYVEDTLQDILFYNPDYVEHFEQEECL